ncbi:hypothetical protein GCM10010397_29400 [Streptomyces spinoverrucosus]|nr:hypothetical protein GCM10010397_29400 [Streptomyces spinoverrucosus]
MTTVVAAASAAAVTAVIALSVVGSTMADGSGSAASALPPLWGSAVPSVLVSMPTDHTARH